MVAEIRTETFNGDSVRSLPAIPNLGDGLRQLRPFQTVSLIEVNRFYPHQFHFMMKSLYSTEYNLGWAPPRDEITSQVDEYIRLLVKVINEQRKTLEMMGNNDEVDHRLSKLLVRINGHSQDSDGKCNVAVQHDLRVLRESLEHGLDTRVFMYMPDRHAEFYDQHKLFGESVATKFPEANKEIILAGNCYAIESYTACVFHLTRAVEIAARVMVSKLQVVSEIKKQGGQCIPVELATWEDLIAALQKGVIKKQAKISTSVRRKNLYEFYNHAVSQFRSFKDAWRNKVSHKRKTYLAGEAKDIMDNVRQFMVHISAELCEPKGAVFD